MDEVLRAIKNPITRCFKIEENMNKLKRRKADLNSRSEDVKGYSKSHPGKKLKCETELWLTNVEKMKAEVQNLDREVAENCNIIKRICLGKRVANKLEESDDLYEKGKFPDGPCVDDDTGKTGPAREEVKETMETGLNGLKNDGGKILISGIGGAGSTEIKIEGETSLKYGDIRITREEKETTETGSNGLDNDGGKILVSGIGGVGRTDIKIQGETRLKYGDITV